MIIKCKMCGGDLQLTEGAVTCECEFCGTTQTVPVVDNEKKANLFNRANRLRMSSEFDKAATVYESIVAEFPEEAEAYWGLCLCAYGIEYVDDAVTGRKIPTCHRTRQTSIMDDSNFDMACEYADAVAKKLYRDEAKEIDRLQQAILQIVAQEEPYDVFICYKEIGADGQRTEDSVLAQEIYDALTAKGMKVFFARITLEDKLGQQYEPYIYAALHSAKVMLAVGTSFEHYDAVWVKNEWGRFLAMMKEDRQKTLIPCYKGIDAYDIPKEFRNLQAQDMGKLGWLQDLTRGVVKLCGKAQTAAAPVQVAVQTAPTSNLDNIMKRAQLFLEDGDFANAGKYYTNALDINAEHAPAYLGQLCVALQLRKPELLASLEKPFNDHPDYQKALRFADPALKVQLESWFEQCQRHIAQLKQQRKEEQRRLEEEKRHAEEVRQLKEQQEYQAAVPMLRPLRERAERFSSLFVPLRISTVIAVPIDGTPVYAHSGYENNSECIGMVDHMVSDAAFAALRDGSIIAVANNTCKLPFPPEKVRGAKAIIKDYVSAALLPNGTVIAHREPNGHKDEAGFASIIRVMQTWKDIVQLIRFPTDDRFIALRRDGTIVYTDSPKFVDKDDFIDLRIQSKNNEVVDKAAKWKDLVAIDCGFSHICALDAGGRVHMSGIPLKGDKNIIPTVESWRNIIAVSTGNQTVAGLRSDGRVLCFPKNDQVSKWTHVIAVKVLPLLGISETRSTTDCIIGLCADGTMLSEPPLAGMAGWRLFQNCETYDQERQECLNRLIKDLEAKLNKASNQLSAATEELGRLSFLQFRRKKELEAQIPLLRKEKDDLQKKLAGVKKHDH